MIRGVRLNQEELTKAYSFLSAVSFDPFGQYHVPPAENTLAYDKVTRWLAKKPDFNSVVENTDKSWLSAYVRDPEVFDANAEGLTEKEKRKIRQLAKFIVNGGV